jgi:hypothetical protein
LKVWEVPAHRAVWIRSDIFLWRSGIQGEQFLKRWEALFCHIMKKLKEQSFKGYALFQVSGIPCLHAIAFITKMGQPLEKYIDSYYLEQHMTILSLPLLIRISGCNQTMVSS